MTDLCPHCHTSLHGDPIPERHLHHNIPGTEWYNPTEPTCEESKARWRKQDIDAGREPDGRCFCLPYGEGKTHFRREIGIEIFGIYDGVLFWQCPDCGWAWHRAWSASWAPEMIAKAEPYVTANNASINVIN